MKRAKQLLSQSLLRTNKKENVGNPQVSIHQPVQGHKYSLRYTGEYKRSRRRYKKRGYKEALLDNVIKILASGEKPPQKCRKHNLDGEYKGCLECHIADDLLLIWQQNDKEKVLTLINIGTHSELFDKKKH